jgi:hypothetical protein
MIRRKSASSAYGSFFAHREMPGFPMVKKRGIGLKAVSVQVMGETFRWS